MLLIGLLLQTPLKREADKFLNHRPSQATEIPTAGLDRHVSPRVVGVTCLVGLVAFSVVACYAYYPAPREVLEEMRLARVDVLSGVSSRDFEQTLHWIPILDEWSRKLEVGHALRHFELRPYQQMQAHLLRKKLELLEHAIEHALDAKNEATAASQIVLEEELQEAKVLATEISDNARRLSAAFGG